MLAGLLYRHFMILEKGCDGMQAGTHSRIAPEERVIPGTAASLSVADVDPFARLSRISESNCKAHLMAEHANGSQSLGRRVGGGYLHPASPACYLSLSLCLSSPSPLLAPPFNAMHARPYLSNQEAPPKSPITQMVVRSTPCTQKPPFGCADQV